MKVSRQEQVARIEHFASLWERFVNLYLDREEFEDISGGKENEFLAMQGGIMRELAAVAEFEEGRFTLVEEVTSVINEATSVRRLKGQSEFQVRRRKERGRQVAELIENVRRFVAERDSAARRREKELKDKLTRPFWDPEKGKFGAIVGRIVVSPARFFSAIRVAGKAQKANSFLLTMFCLLSAGCVIIITGFNAGVARAISYNVNLELGILTSDVTAVAKVVIWVFVVVGVAIVSFAGAMVGVILGQVLVIVMHGGFKMAGGKGRIVASHKVVVFGLAPVLLLVMLPVVGRLVQNGEVGSWLLVVFPAVAICYVGVLHVIGFNKVHGAGIKAGIVGWLIGMVLFAAVVLAAMGIWHASLDRLAPLSGRYVYVTAKESRMLAGNRVVHTVWKGEPLKLLGEEGKFYRVRSGKEEGRIKKSDGEVRAGSIWSLPGFLVESTAAQVENLIYKLIRKFERESK